MTRKQLIMRAFNRALTDSPINWKRLKIRARNVAISCNYDSDIVEEIQCMKYEQIYEIVKSMGEGWKDGKAWKLN